MFFLVSLMLSLAESVCKRLGFLLVATQDAAQMEVRLSGHSLKRL